MEYVVSESRRNKNYDSKPGDAPVKVHTALCTHYETRKSDIWSMKWSPVFDNIKDAEKFAKQAGREWDYCRACLRKKRATSLAVA